MRRTKVIITKKKSINVTINPQTTSYLSFKELILKLRQEDEKNSTEFTFFENETQTWKKITSEWCWQELLQFKNISETLILKLFKTPQVLKIQEQFSCSFGCTKPKGVSGLIGQMEVELRHKSYQQTLEKLRELGYSNTERCKKTKKLTPTSRYIFNCKTRKPL
jgi:hypothetical protein